MSHPHITSNVLGDLAASIKQFLGEARAAELTAAERYLEAGRLLLRAKEACGHGEWLPFLKQAGVEERTAQRYMKLAKSDLKSDTVSDLGGILPASEFLDEPKFPPRGKYLFVRRLMGRVGYFGWVWECQHGDGEGYYHYRVHRISGDNSGYSNGEGCFTKQAMKPRRVMVDGRSINIFWTCFCMAMGCRSVTDFEVLGTFGGGGFDELWEEEREEALMRDIAEAQVWVEQHQAAKRAAQEEKP